MTDCPKIVQGTVRKSSTPGFLLKKSPIDLYTPIPERKIETRWSRKREPFLKGPIPVRVLQDLEGKALKLYLAARHREDLVGSSPVTLANQFLESWGICRSTKSDALRSLEAKGLIAVDRSPGRAVRVTVLRR